MPAVLQEEEKLQKERIELTGKRGEPEIEDHKANEENFDDVELDDSDDDEDKPGFDKDSEDLILGQYNEVQRTKNKQGRKYKFDLFRVIMRIEKRDYIANKLKVEVEY